MSVKQQTDIDSYQFVEFSSVGDTKLTGSNSSSFVENEFVTDENSTSSLINEVDTANKKDFIIDQKVFDLRKHRSAKKNELEKKIEDRIQIEITRIKEAAYKEGFEKGLSDGVQKAYNEQEEVVSRKTQEFNGMIDNLLNRENEIIKLQDNELRILIRDLVKWISLKELKEDDQYITRLIKKIVEENKKTSKISFQIGKGVVASFNDSIKRINEKLIETYNGKVDLVENPSLSKDAIEVEIGNSILRADVQEQLKVFDLIFENNGD